MSSLEEHVPVNRARGEVPLPEAGEGAFLRFDVDTLERLESKYGDDYINTILTGLARVKISVYQTVIACSMKNCTNGEIPFGMSFETLQQRILDGLYMTIHGRTYDQQKAHEEVMLRQQADALSADPRVASYLSSMPPGKQGIDQA